ncbi:MAG: hypothetical protein ACI9W4_001064 [Rhodothermales bacterium]
MNKLALISVAAVLAASPATAQRTVGTWNSVANCEPAQAESVDFEIGNMRTPVRNDGLLFWSPGGSGLEVPSGSGNYAIWRGFLQIAGIRDGDTLAVAGTHTDASWWPGGIPATKSSCANADQLVEHRFSADRRQQQEATTQWGHAYGAPVLDGDGDPSNFDPDAGDRAIAFGDAMVNWVMNDVGNAHVGTIPSGPMGLEVRGTVFGFDSHGVISNALFHRFEITNTGPTALRETYFGVHVDADLGNFRDDRIAIDSSRGLGFFFNGDNDDDGGYGLAPPAIGIQLLEGPAPVWTSFFPIECSGCLYTGRPRDPPGVHRNLSGHWLDGQPFTRGAHGRSWTDQPTSLFFTGDPITGAYWSEVTPTIPFYGSIEPGDRHAYFGVGPTTLEAGQTQVFVFAALWSRGSDNLDSIRQLREDSDFLDSAKDAILTPRVLHYETASAAGLDLAVGVFPNPASTEVFAVFRLPESMMTSVKVYDILGREVSSRIGVLPPGETKLRFSTRLWSPGLYLLRLTAGQTSGIRRIVVEH